MDNKYLIDRETLVKFVDPVIAQKYPEAKEPELSQIREENVKKLDDLICDAIFDDLTLEQLEGMKEVLSSGDDDQDAICEFLDNNNINLEKKILKALEQFKLELLGGGHA